MKTFWGTVGKYVEILQGLTRWFGWIKIINLKQPLLFYLMDNYNQLAILIGTKRELGSRRTTGTANGMTPGAGDTKANHWPG